MNIQPIAWHDWSEEQQAWGSAKAGCLCMGRTGTFAETGGCSWLSNPIPGHQSEYAKMSAGQSSGTGATIEFDDEKVRKNEILSNREKAQRRPGQSLDGKGVQVDEYKDNPANRRPSSGDGPQSDVKAVAKEPTKPSPKTDKPEPTDASEQVDRPGFDLGGSTGETHAGKGLGLGTDAKENRKGWSLPR